MIPQNIPDAIDRLRSLLAQRLHLRAPTLSGQVAKVGRRVPRRIRRDLAVVARAEGMAQNPKLARQIDARQVAQAARNAAHHLETVDPTALRIDRVLRATLKVALLMLAVFIGTVWYLWAQGRI